LEENMGQVRLTVEANEAAEEIVPLPKHWDELDEDEKHAWISHEIDIFRQKHFRVVTQISE
jgi:hypothetical protein